MALHGLYCAGVPLRNCSLMHFFVALMPLVEQQGWHLA